MASNLPPFLEANAAELKADFGLICDTNMWNPTTPAIQTMLRGLCGEETDHHGRRPGSALGLLRVGRREPEPCPRPHPGRPARRGRPDHVPNFYDGVPELPETLRQQWASLDFDPAAFLGAVGLSLPAGEKGRSVLEMTWSRPTCEINGMGGGYQGEGFKTVIPAQASAKVSFRLVFDQDPHAIRRNFREFVRARLPADCKVEFLDHGSGRAIRFPIEATAFTRTQQALSAEWGKDAVFIGGGGSIPVTHELKTKLGMDVVLAGFALEDDRIHSPNEKYDLESFHRGIRSWVRVLDALAE